MLLLLVGNIASGKSTLVRQLAGPKTLIINDDAITTAIHQDYTLYQKSLKPLYKSIENDILTWGLSHGYTVIVDRPNLTRQSRARYIHIARSLDTKYIRCIIMSKDTPENHAQRRAQNGRGYTYEQWLEVAKLNEAKYNEPKYEEGFDAIWDDSPETVGLIQGLIQKSKISL